MEERYPTQKKIWTCPKCESTEYSEDTVTMIQILGCSEYLIGDMHM